MCRKNRNNYRYQMPLNMNRSLLSGVSPVAQFDRKSLVMDAAIETVNRFTAKPTITQQPQYANQTPVYPDDLDVDYTRDIKEDFSMDEPPAYEKVAAVTAPEAVARAVTQQSVNGFESPQPARTLQLPTQYRLTPDTFRLLQILSATLFAYQSGNARRRQVRKAQRHLGNKLYETEVARRSSVHGRLRCGEKCEIWNEIKDIDFGY